MAIGASGRLASAAKAVIVSVRAMRMRPPWVVVFTLSLAVRADAHVGPRRVGQRLELALARDARRDLLARALAHPRLPVGPPRALVLLRAREPRVGRRRERVVGP